MKVVVSRKIVVDDDIVRAVRLERCSLDRWQHSDTDSVDDNAALIAAASCRLNWDSDFRDAALRAASSDGVGRGT